jgi:DNA-binding Lrp family transcriptional regulator
METPRLLDPLDRALIAATQEGLPLVSEPYVVVAQSVGCTEDEVIERLTRMLDQGIIRRIGVVPNHYKIGYRANGMTVWNVPDESVDELGALIGAMEAVSHCYHRPRHLPDWPYNLFAMVHGKTPDDVEVEVERIAERLGHFNLGYTVLYSTRILKKTGLRLSR